MKIAIVGKGTSAIITALTCIKNGHEVEIYYDKTVPFISVGESTTPHIGNLIYEVLGISISDMCLENIASLKVGINFIDWGKTNSFEHNFNNNQMAFHFESGEFNPWVTGILENSGMVKFIPQKVKQYKVVNNSIIINENTYDFVIFSNGWDEGSYYTPLIETVNSALLYTQDIGNHLHHTVHRATENGWQFGLPFPKRKLLKCGYLYNNKITLESDIDLEKNNIKDFRKINWIPRYSKKLIENQFCAYNGNRLFFMEPLQALSLFYYKEFAEYICKFLEERNEERIHYYNNLYHYEIWAYQLSLAYHYNFGSKFSNISEYWKKIEEQSSNLMNSVINGRDELFIDNIKCDLQFNTKHSKIGTFDVKDHKQLYCGMSGISLESLFNNI